MQKIFLIIGAVLAGLAVALGAFGAHGLKKVVSPENVAIYQTGVQYQMYHALALMLVGILSERIINNYLSYAGVLFVAGVIFFSGSLYLIVSLYAMNKSVPTAVGILTPIGGLFFILGWICLLVSLLKK
ncbi:DUF423 domain-containing protein [Flavisolibacter nicotianae]|uniref:DUF423 domain-containing protein n=1 Tax=Flavisolibacter nicotianae TaxID=2364882 RepID=UPI000EB4F67C|nr:DUF423 domain-containing protein [Flavisolibacter nicotianae]